MAEPGHDEFESLRTIVVGPEQKLLRKLEQRIEDTASRAQDVSEVLPRAIGLRAGRDKKLQGVIQPVLEEVLRISVQKNPRILADALFPIIGAAIRKALASALENMIRSFTRLQEQSFSARGIGWRLEGIRTGKSFGEIVLLKSLLYRVEQVFLIHRESGLLLVHREAPNVVARDADMVSAMLTAIQDFVHDSFGGAETRDIEQIRVGELTVWIQHGPLALLAGVVKGAAPQALRNVFAESIEEIHQQQSPQLAAFNGDASAFQTSAPQVDRCLLGKAPESSGQRSNLALAVTAGLILAALLVWAGYGWWQHRIWDCYLDRLRAEPGIVLADSRYRSISGLRDPLARDPIEMLREEGIAAEKVRSRWEPYHSLAPRFAAIRVKASIESQRIYFELNQSELGEQQRDTLVRVAGAIREHLDLTGGTATITGQADAGGDAATNTRLAEERARQVFAGLVNLRVPADRLRLGSDPAASARAVSFRVR